MWSYDYNYFMSGNAKKLLIGGSLPKGVYPRLGGKYLFSRQVGNRYTFRPQAMWLDYMRKYAALKKLKKTDANWIMLSNRYEYLQLMSAYCGSVGGHVVHYACRGMFSENYFKLPMYFGGDFTKNAPISHKMTFDQFSKKAGNIFCIPHNTNKDREFFKDVTRAGILAVMPVDVDAYLTDKHVLGLIGNYSGLLGQVRFFKLLSNKNFLEGVLKKKKNAPAFIEALSRTADRRGGTLEKVKKSKRGELDHEMGVFYRKAREPHRRKYYKQATRNMWKTLTSKARGFAFSEEERKFHEYKFSRYYYKLENSIHV